MNQWLVAGLKGNKFYPDVKPNMKPVLLKPMGLRLVNGFDRLKWHWWPSYGAINTEEYKNRPVDKETDRLTWGNQMHQKDQLISFIYLKL